MSDNGANCRQTNDGGQREQRSGIRPQKPSIVTDMSDWAKREEIVKRKNQRLQQVSRYCRFIEFTLHM